MCMRRTALVSWASERVKDVLCKECLSRVKKKIGNTGKFLVEFAPEEYPLCPECLKKANHALKKFSEEMLRANDADVR